MVSASPVGLCSVMFLPVPAVEDCLHARLHKEAASCGFWKVGYSKNALVRAALLSYAGMSVCPVKAEFGI